MNWLKALAFKYRILRSSWWRWQRMLFPSPAEVRFLELFGGKVVRIESIKHPKTKFPIAVYWNLGKLFKSEKFKREVRCGKYFIDFGNDLAMGLEIDGRDYHTNIVAAFDRDTYLYGRGWRVIHISAVRLWLEPSKVQTEILKFLYT